jgi:hypothetical protein
MLGTAPREGLALTMLDTRDLQRRLDELQDMADAHEEDPENEPELDEEEASELAELVTLSDEVSEWHDGATLIPVSDFEDYARDLADDLGMIPSDAAWPLTCIDWEKAAGELEQDYSEVTYLGTDYLVRS